MSRIDDLRERHKMMVLNADILDAIRNRKYSLRHRPDPVVGGSKGSAAARGGWGEIRRFVVLTNYFLHGTFVSHSKAAAVVTTTS